MKKDYVYLFLTLFSILVIGLIQLPFPFTGDQAFYLTGAREMDMGMVLYRDFWDIKQPGIFIFYLVAGKLFGFNVIGIHLFELLYWLIFAVILILWLRKYIFFDNTVFAYISTLMFVGSYFAFCFPVLQTQVEALVSAPLLLVLACNTAFILDERKRGFWLIFSGIFGGIVIQFKLMLLPIVFVLWIAMFVRYLNYSRHLKDFLRFLYIPFGILLICFPFIYYCIHYNIVDLVIDTFFKYPPLILKYGQPKPLSHLFSSVGWFIKIMSLFIPFFIYGIIKIRKNSYIIDLTLWLTVGTFVILLQKNSWYTQHFQLLYLPIILIAVFAIADIYKHYSLSNLLIKKVNKVFAITAIFIIVSLAPVLYLVKKTAKLYHYNFGFTPNDRQNLAATFNDSKKAIKIASYVKSESSNCPIFVVDDPLIYYYTDKLQAISQSGWSLHLFIPGQYQILYNELIEKKPYLIFIDNLFVVYLSGHEVNMLPWIQTNYRVLSNSTEGTWYRIRDDVN